MSSSRTSPPRTEAAPLLPSETLAAIERAIWQVGREAFGASAVGPRSLARGIEELSARYNATLATPAAAPRLMPARLLFFTVADLPKLAWPLGELQRPGQLRPAGSRLRILDLGAGCGAQTLSLVALLDRGPAEGLAIDAVDRDRHALELLDAVLARCRSDVGCGRRTELRIHATDATRFALDPPYDLVVAGSLLAELPKDQRRPLVLRLLEALAPQGQLVLLEPALRQSARDLHALRDELLRTGAASVFAPCTRSGPCPALADPGDWCHERRSWAPPPALRALAQSTGLRRRDLKWSYLTLNRAGSSVDASGAAWRVVSAPLRSKGKLELHLCGPAGRSRVVRLDRHRAPENAALDRLDRGHLVWLEGLDPGASGTLRLGPGSTLRAEDPAGHAAASDDT